MSVEGKTSKKQNIMMPEPTAAPNTTPPPKKRGRQKKSTTPTASMPDHSDGSVSVTASTTGAGLTIVSGTMPVVPISAGKTIPYQVLAQDRTLLAEIQVKQLSEEFDSREVTPAPIESLAQIPHINEVVTNRKDTRRLKQIAWEKYQIGRRKKALEAADKVLELEGRELLVMNDVTGDVRFDFLRLGLGHGGGGKTPNKEMLLALGVAPDVIDAGSKKRKSWERMQVSDGAAKRSYNNGDVIDVKSEAVDSDEDEEDSDEE